MDGSYSNELKKERTFPTLQLTPLQPPPQQLCDQPIFEIHSPKTPTLSRKLKAVSLDSDPPSTKETSTTLEISHRDVFSMPNTPKRQIKHRISADLDDKTTLCTTATLTAPSLSSNLKKFASNNSISGSQTLKTLPEIMTLHDFSDNKTEPVKIKARGLLERRGSNASLTIELGSNSNLSEKPVVPVPRLNTAKSVSNLNLSAFDTKCPCFDSEKKVTVPLSDRRRSQEACNSCTIYESVPTKKGQGRNKCTMPPCISSSMKCRRKSLSNENLYVPPCGFCQKGGNGSGSKECSPKCRGHRKAYYPRQPDVDQAASQLLSDDFKLHLENVQYLQTAGRVLSVGELKAACEMSRVPKLHSEFWEVPLNHQEKCYVSGSQSRNRYKGVFPNEHSRVHLPGPQPYIHANYIKGPDYAETAYIATQGPMAHTCQDFWEMVWHTNCDSIVMLTQLVEKGRNKCELYFPLGKTDQSDATTAPKSYFYVTTTRERDKFTFNPTRNNFTPKYEEQIIEFERFNQITFNGFTIRYLSEQTLDECVIRQLELQWHNNQESCTKNVRKIHHYWFPNWQDHKMANPEQLLKMALHLLDKRQDGGCAKWPPIVVHCSAGIGRTGCFLAILNGIQQLQTNENVDVLAILCSLRLNRGGMVQTAEQYELIHKVLALYVDSKR